MYFRVFLKKMVEDGFQVGRIITLLKSRFKWRIHTDKCNSTNLETKVCNFSTLQILLVFSLLFALKILHKKYKGNLPLALLLVSYRFSDMVTWYKLHRPHGFRKPYNKLPKTKPGSRVQRPDTIHFRVSSVGRTESLSVTCRHYVS